MTPLALTANEAAELVGYVDGAGVGRGDRIRELWREARFPDPIDVELPVAQLRWSCVRVEEYVTGAWRPQ